jgi:hypothetical protein
LVWAQTEEAAARATASMMTARNISLPRLSDSCGL